MKTFKIGEIVRYNTGLVRIIRRAPRGRYVVENLDNTYVYWLRFDEMDKLTEEERLELL